MTDKNALESGQSKAQEGCAPLPVEDHGRELRAIRELEDDLGEKICKGTSLADLL